MNDVEQIAMLKSKDRIPSAALPVWYTNAVVTLVLFLGSGATAGLTLLAGPAQALILVPNYITIAYVILRTRGRLFLVFAQMPLLLFLLIAVCSASWSLAPAFTLTAAARLAVTFLTAASVIYLSGWDRALACLGRAMTLAGIFSLALYPFPSISFGPYGDFQGLFQQKNILGFSAVIGFIISFNSVIFDKKPLFSYVGLCVALSCVVLSASVTSLLIVLVVGVLLGVYKLLAYNARGHAPWILSIVTVVVIVIGVAGLLSENPILGALGRDSSFSGRADLWNSAKALVAAKPFLGYGYQSLFSEDNQLAKDLIAKHGDYALQFHNSYLNIAVQLGVIGLIFNVWWFALVFRAAYRNNKVRLHATSRAPLIFAFATCLLLQSFSESTFGSPRSLATLLLVLILLEPFWRRELERRKAGSAQVA